MYKDLVAIINAAYEPEQVVTDQINKLARFALDHDDFSTFNMLQWFIAEQREQMMLFRGIVDYIRITGFNTGDEMVNMDRYLTAISAKG